MEKRQQPATLPWEKENDGDQLVSVVHPRVHHLLPMGVAVVLSLISHTAAVFLVPSSWFYPEGGEAAIPRPRTQTFQLKLVPPEPPPPQPERYVETNRDVVENKPDETLNFAARDQQASQVIKSKKIGPDPVVDGDELDSTRILSGELVQQVQSAPSGGERRGSEHQSQESTEVRPVLPSPSPAPRLKQDQLAEEGLASWTEVADAREVPKVDPTEKVVVPLSLNPVVAALQEASRNMPQGSPSVGPDTPQPRPRPRLQVEATRGPLRKSATGLANSSGHVAWDANFSEFGDYTQRMFDAIQLKWDELNRYGQNSISEVRTHVNIEFYVTKSGQIEDLKVVQTNANQAAVWRCVDAIEANAPYLPWTADMVQLLGDRQPVRVRFRYN